MNKPTRWRLVVPVLALLFVIPCLGYAEDINVNDPYIYLGPAATGTMSLTSNGTFSFILQAPNATNTFTNNSTSIWTGLKVVATPEFFSSRGQLFADTNIAHYFCTPQPGAPLTSCLVQSVTSSEVDIVYWNGSIMPGQSFSFKAGPIDVGSQTTRWGDVQFAVTPQVPEPASILLVAASLLGLGFQKRRQ